MKLKNILKKFMFLVMGLVVIVIVTLSACDGGSAGARMLSGQGSRSVHSHGQTFNNVSELSSFPGPDGQLALRFVYKGEPIWCFSAGCIRGGGNIAGSDMTTRSAE
jgi:hypothetical protein